MYCPSHTPNLQLVLTIALPQSPLTVTVGFEKNLLLLLKIKKDPMEFAHNLSILLDVSSIKKWKKKNSAIS